MSLRPIKRLIQAKPTVEGAGVRLRRAFGFGNTSDFDPFLLLDDFRNDVPDDYLAGFPWHPHRGIETITYVLAGTVDHGDSLGNRGSIGAGDIQWMTAGRGIIHQEMPKGDHLGQMHGFQLWANLPSSLKMSAPRYQEIKAPEIPELTDDDGTKVRLVCGSFWGKRGPVEGIAADPVYIDVSVPPGKRKTLPVETTRHAFAYVFAGSGKFCNASGPLAVPTEGVQWLETTPPTEAGNRSLILFDCIRQTAGGTGGLVRPHRHEHPGTAPASLRRTPRRNVPQNRVRTTHEHLVLKAASGRKPTRAEEDSSGADRRDLGLLT
jgi:redox-sensitive bicupin YhaK (pirin superfamily)